MYTLMYTQNAFERSRNVPSNNLYKKLFHRKEKFYDVCFPLSCQKSFWREKLLHEC